jgi:hypothetical protein
MRSDVSVFLTDKYVHKYPQRYFTYLIASHLKAAIIMAFFLWIIGRIAGPVVAPQDVLWTGYLFFVLADAIVSIFHRRDIPDSQSSVLRPSLCTEDITDDPSSDSSYNNAGLSSIDTQAIAREIRPHLDNAPLEFIEKSLPDLHGDNGDVLFLDDVTTTDDQSKSAPIALLVGRIRINDVLRLNRFLMFCTRRITMGGFIVVRYMPLENVIKNFKRRHIGLLYWMVYSPFYLVPDDPEYPVAGHPLFLAENFLAGHALFIVDKKEKPGSSKGRNLGSSRILWDARDCRIKRGRRSIPYCSTCCIASPKQKAILLPNCCVAKSGTGW